MQDFEKLGVFYLGKRYDLAPKAPLDELLLYDSKDLTTHAVCVGMTGSGKTGLCLALLEEAAIDGIPAIVIDPKGDLGNLLLTFPDLQPDDFQPWIDPADATRKGITRRRTRRARRPSSGAKAWPRGAKTRERIRTFRDAVDIAIYTPGSNAGLPLTVLRSFTAPPAAVRDDADALRERIQAAVSGLLALLGIDADPLRSREHILLSNLLDRAWRDGTRSRSRRADPPDSSAAVRQGRLHRSRELLPGEGPLRTGDAAQQPARLARLSRPGWKASRSTFSGCSTRPKGKPRLSILSIAHLVRRRADVLRHDPAQRSDRLDAARSRARRACGRLLYMDEVFGYFPPTANPPSKTPMLTLLKQARAFGLGVVLATQNPVDLDYKGLSNCGTWFLGRLQTERDKLRVLDGLEGASAAAGANVRSPANGDDSLRASAIACS